MYGGTISGNQALNNQSSPTGLSGVGGGVYVRRGTTGGAANDYSGAFNMYGGTISGNKASYGGGGVSVYDDGMFDMQGGKISENDADSNGGGMYVMGGTFTMLAGEIHGNKSLGGNSNGGGVYVDSGSFIMEGGKISGNKTQNSGGGVFIANNFEVFSKAGGIIYGSDALADLKNTAGNSSGHAIIYPNPLASDNISKNDTLYDKDYLP
jgi:hypothetical protein